MTEVEAKKLFERLDAPGESGHPSAPEPASAAVEVGIHESRWSPLFIGPLLLSQQSFQVALLRSMTLDLTYPGDAPPAD